jgi:hypothetical protein
MKTPFAAVHESGFGTFRTCQTRQPMSGFSQPCRRNPERQSLTRFARRPKGVHTLGSPANP